MCIAHAECVLIYPVVWVELYCLLESNEGLRGVTAIQVRWPQAAIEVIRIGRERKSAVQLCNSFRVFTRCSIDATERGMHFRQLVIIQLRLLCSRQSLLRPKAVLLDSVHAQACVGYARIRKGKLWVRPQRLIEVIERRLHAFTIVSSHGIATAQIQVICGGVIRRPGLGSSKLIISRVDIETRDELRVDLVFQSE